MTDDLATFPLRPPDDKRITRNSARCLDCGDEIVSGHVHDFVTCSCGNLSVDGGNYYTRRLFRNANWVDTSEYE
jgi:hypothetical protein